MESHTPDHFVRGRKVGLFLILAFGIAWVASLVFYLLEINLQSLTGAILLVTFFMWAPAFAAICTQLIYGESIRDGCGIALGRIRWIALAWLTPVALIFVAIGIGSVLPGVSVTTDYAAYLIDAGLSPEEASEAADVIEALPGPVILLFVLQGLVAGLTINALAALGEELGWRGLLLTELAPLGFWKLSIFTGVVWGLWHAPIILQGHNFPEAPIAGIAMMTLATTVIAPIYTYVTVRAQSVLAATLLHGSFNGLGALTVVYLAGMGNLVISPVGVVGIGAAGVVIILVLIHDRLIAETPITTGSTLDPWE